MHHYLPENDITPQGIQAIVRDASWSIEPIEANISRLTTQRGYRLRMHVDPKRRYIDFDTYLPLRLDYPGGLALANSLNDTLRFASHSVDADNDLGITYSLSRERGVLVPQLLRVIDRFASLIDSVVERYATHDNGRSIFDFERNRPTAEDPGLA